MKTTHIGNGLKDGPSTAGTGFYIRRLTQLGATEITLARTGRLTFVFDGIKRVYTVTAPRDRHEADAFETAGTTESPMAHAIRDLEGPTP